ncbi:MAG: ribosome-associated translation inhibitor RaiA [Polyangiales bacterium]
MQLPLQITFRDLESSPAVVEHIRHRATKLETLFDRITGCRVALSAVKRGSHHAQHRIYHVRIDLTVPGVELAVGSPPSHGAARAGHDLYLAVDEAFHDAERLLEEHKRKRSDDRRHGGVPHARVSKLFPDGGHDGYGFLETRDGREIYFHEHSVLNRAFDLLEVGSEVRFAEEDGDKGPQASTVAMVGKARRHARAKPSVDEDDVHERPTWV